MFFHPNSIYAKADKATKIKIDKARREAGKDLRAMEQWYYNGCTSAPFESAWSSDWSSDWSNDGSNDGSNDESNDESNDGSGGGPGYWLGDSAGGSRL